MMIQLKGSCPYKGVAEVKHIAIIEDDRDLSFILSRHLEKNGYHVTTIEDGQKAIEYDYCGTDLIILDLQLPNVNGEQVCENIKGRYHIPIIITSCKDKLSDRLNCFAKGADDYLIKPFDYRELIYRIQRRLLEFEYSKSQDDSCNGIVRLKNMVINQEKKQVAVQCNPLNLTPAEYKILETLAVGNCTYTFDELHQIVWGESRMSNDRALAVHISNLRKKIQQYEDLQYILTERGTGYRINEFLLR